MNKLLHIHKQLSRLFEIDRIVTQARQKEYLKVQQLVALIGAFGFGIMSVLNIKQHSTIMLYSTIGSCLLFLMAYIVGLFTKKNGFVKIAFFSVMLVLLPVYTVWGGNDGFACLWVILVTYLVMYVVDYKIGIFVCLFYFLILVLFFLGPLKPFLQYDGYSETFLLRFPALFLINFAFSCYICGTMRVYQYNLLMDRKKLEETSIRDLLTGIYNRNAYITFINDFDPTEYRSVAVVYMDANGLHELNNSHGHGAGDLMLQTVATLSSELFVNQKCYRVGGDEFVIFCADCNLDYICERAEAVASTVSAKGYSVSTGIAWYEGVPGLNLTEITKEANETMLRNKSAYYEALGANRANRSDTEQLK